MVAVPGYAPKPATPLVSLVPALLLSPMSGVSGGEIASWVRGISGALGPTTAARVSSGPIRGERVATARQRDRETL